ncbi:MAG: DNA repair protein RecN [Pseudomonadota bacterium]
MLESLQVRHFALIDSLALDVDGGLTVLTGETGAGKSILLDALGLVLGARADKAAVRHGADKAEVSALFHVGSRDDVKAWLAEQALIDADTSDECLVRRVVTSDGRSRAFINLRPVTVQHLRELGTMLVEIHGQHAHHALLKSTTQRDLLDGFAGHADLIATCRQRYGELNAARAACDALREQLTAREDRLQFLQFQSSELEPLLASAEAFTALTNERNRLAHADRLNDATTTALSSLYDSDDSAQSRIAAAGRALDGIVDIAAELAPARELLNEADVLVSEVVEAVRRYADQLEANPARLDDLESTLASVTHAARKQGIDVSELPVLHAKLLAEQATLQDADASLANLETKATAAATAYNEAAAKLTASRDKAATRLGKAVSATMAGLGLANGSFSVAVEPAERSGPAGADTVRFDVTTNPGQPPSPLAKTASGGELARISLALQVNLADVTGTPTLIFDEVDAGIGGGVAEIVGRRLAELGDSRQVLSVTHLAQVASCAHHHWKVSKRALDNVTTTDVRVLHDDERIQELARMIGGVELTDATLQHAREMLATNGPGAATRRRA